MHHAAQARSRTQTHSTVYSQDEHDAAYGRGQFVAKYWPAARKAMPEGSTLRDWRDKCARDFLSNTIPEGHGLLPSLLAGFDDEAEDRYPLTEFSAPRRAAVVGDTVLCIDVEDAGEWLTLGKAYRVHAVVGSVLVITDDSGDPEGRHHASHFTTV